MDFDEYERWMRDQDPLITDFYDKGDGTCLYVKRLMFHWTLLGSVIGDEYGYDDRWCYQTREGAVAAVEQWRSHEWIGEPYGWHRHHKTGRRRPDGDHRREYISR